MNALARCRYKYEGSGVLSISEKKAKTGIKAAEGVVDDDDDEEDDMMFMMVMLLMMLLMMVMMMMMMTEMIESMNE